MRSQPLAASTGNSIDPFTSGISDRDESLSRIQASIRSLKDELLAGSVQDGTQGLVNVRSVMQGLAREIVGTPRPNRHDSWVTDVLALVKEMHEVGAQDGPLHVGELALAREYLTRGWPGLLAAMLQAPAWQVADAPEFDAVPEWLWGDYAAWLFQVPLRFATGARPSGNDFRAKRMRDLERLVQRNTGSASIRAALAGYLQGAAVGFDMGDDALAWRQQVEPRGRLLTRAHVRGGVDYDPPVAPRHGRRLRLGFIARSFGPHPDVFLALPCFEQIDARAFDVFLFPLSVSETPEAEYCSRRARATQIMPESTAERVALLRNAQLDAVIFIGELGAEWNDLTELALHRIAPLQAVNHRTGFSTGLPEMDLYISSTEVAGAAFTERVGIVRGPLQTLAFAQPDQTGKTTAPLASRDEVGLPPDRVVLAAVVDGGGAGLEQLDRWAAMLAASESSHLALAFVHEHHESSLARFCLAVDRAMSRREVEQGRVTIFPTSASRPHETRALIALADIVLDSVTPRFSGWIAAEAMRSGVPVVAVSNPGNAGTSAILGAVGLPELAVPTHEDEARLVADLVADAPRRVTLRDQIRAAMEATPEFMDSLAASDAFGALIETAFDELASLGREEFRRQTEAVRCFSVEDCREATEAGLAAHTRGDIENAAHEASMALRSSPLDTRVRHLQGIVLHAQGNTSRAVDYLLAAVQRSDATVAMWYSLALALRDNRQTGEAIQVLETCIRLDNHNVDALFTLLELAEAAGAKDIARDVIECLREVAPDDPRLVASN